MSAFFDSDKMYTYIKAYATAKGWDDVVSALSFARQAHKGQLRKGGEPYIVHPLTMGCHAIALHVNDQCVIAANLLHDVCEDCDVSVSDIPVEQPEIKHAVSLLTHAKGTPLDDYYREIGTDPVASLCKLFDRCNNVSTMAGVFSTEKTLSYIEETKTYVMPLWRKTKDMWPNYSDTLFTLKYHILSVCDGLERTLPHNEP